MGRTHISSTPRNLMNAVRYQGILVSDNYAQLKSMLERNLSDRHALFFAEPVLDAAGQNVDWYSDAPEPPVPLATLPRERQEAARAAVRNMAAEMEAFAESLKEEGQGSKFIRGNILSLALSYPGEEYIYMAGEQPVLTGWGFTPATIGMAPEPLIRLGAVMPAAAAPPGAVSVSAGAPVSKPGCLGPLLAFLLGILLLIGAGFLLMLLFGPAGCVDQDMLRSGCAKVPGMPGCTRQEAVEAGQPDAADTQAHDQVTALTAEKEKEESLRRQIESLRKQLALRARECVREKPQEPAPEEPLAQPQPEPEPEEPPSLAELMPTTPDPPPKADPPPKPAPQPKPKPEPKPEPKAEAPKPKKPEAPKSPNLVIPEDAARNNDLSFLEGCWTNATTLRDGRTRKPIRSTYCFDKNGQGTRTEQGIGHDLSCRGGASARFVNGQLRITASEAACTSRGRGRGKYPREAIVCDRTKDGTANCYESQNDRWKAKLQRVK